MTKARLECENSFTPAGRGSLASQMIRRSASPGTGKDKRVPAFRVLKLLLPMVVEHLKILIPESESVP